MGNLRNLNSRLIQGTLIQGYSGLFWVNLETYFIWEPYLNSRLIQGYSLRGGCDFVIKLTNVPKIGAIS